MRPLRYIFRRVLLHRMSVPTERDPALAALTATTMLVGVNLACIGLFVAARANIPTASWGLMPKLAWIIALVLVVGGVQHRMWVADGRYLIVARDDPAEAPATRRFRSILIWTYVVLSVIAIPLLAILARN